MTFYWKPSPWTKALDKDHGNSGGHSAGHNDALSKLFKILKVILTHSHGWCPPKDCDPRPCICFLAGTRVATPDGPAAIETLRAGDPVMLAGGGTAPVRWVGRQTIVVAEADPLRAMPVRIPAGALGGGLPVRDLLVSPDHALLLDGVLVQAGALVDGAVIRREPDVPETFTYWHVELADHGLLLVEGVAAESFVDNNAALAFDNWQERAALADGAPLGEMTWPRAKSARQVPATLRARLPVVA